MLFLLFATPLNSHAQPIEWPVSEGGNGHFYELILTADVDTWDQAHFSCINSSHEGFRGHLVTITSQAENDWMLNTVIFPYSPGHTVFFMGGWNAGLLDDTDLNEQWFWITGEEWDFEAWATGEPGSFREKVLSLLHQWFDNPLIQGTGWNNLQYSYPNNNGYIIEYDDLPVIELPPLFPASTDSQSWGAVKAMFR